MTFTSNDEKKYLSLEDELKYSTSGWLTVSEYAGNGWFKHFRPYCYPVARDMVERRIVKTHK